MRKWIPIWLVIVAIAVTGLSVAFHVAARSAIDAIAGPNAGIIAQIDAANQWVKVQGTTDVMALFAWLVTAGVSIRNLLRARRRA